MQTDDIQRRRAIWSIIQVKDVLGGQGPNKGKRSTGYFVMDEAGVINGVVTFAWGQYTDVADVNQLT